MRIEEFNKLFKKYLRGEASPEEVAQLEDWHKKQPDIELADLSNEEKKALEKRLWGKIRSEVAEMKPAGLWGWVASGVAACLVVGFIGWGMNSRKHPASEKSGWEQKRFEVKNTTGADQEIMLSDSTLVILKQNSRLTYEADFNQSRRDVNLYGEAFFQVKRDEMRPFAVYSGNLVTEVLGTSFLVTESKESNTTKVLVTEGKVSVYAKMKSPESEGNGVILTANQQISYNQETNHITTGIVDEPVLKDMDDTESLPPLYFKAESLGNVLNILTKYYGIEFVVVNPKLKNCGINADLTGLSMFLQIGLICRSIDATYERRGTVIFIHGDGC